MRGSLGFSGAVAGRILPDIQKAPLTWKIKNTLRFSFLFGLFAKKTARAFTRLTGIPTIVSELRAKVHLNDGSIVDYGIICHRLVTDAGVAFLVDDWDNNGADLTTLNFHASGTTNTAEAAGDTALGAEATTVTDRVAGTRSQPAANQYRSVGTQTFTGTAAIVEHGLFSVVTESAGTLWDRSVFAALNVVNGNSIEWTYTVTVNAGG